MITIIVGTDRVNSRSKVIAKHYQERLSALCEEEVQLFSLEDIKKPYLINNNYNAESQSDELAEIQNRYFIGADRWVIVVPEYNGGLPGVFKSLMDAMSIREYGPTFGNKKILIAGVSAGKAGNLRGLDYLTNLMSYVKANVFKNRLPISQVESLIKDDKLVDKATKETIDAQIKEFLLF